MDRYCFTEAERAVMESSEAPFAVYQLIDKRVVTLILSKGFCDLFGYEDRDEAYFDMDNDMYKETHKDDVARIADAAFRFATEGAGYDVIYRSKYKSGQGYKLIHAQGTHTYPQEGVQLATIWYTDEGLCDDGGLGSKGPLTETLEKAIYEESYLKASYYDHLTGLPSMTYFFDLAELEAEKIRRGGGSPAMVFTDFSGMKYFNHRNGFAEGDRLLQAFSRVLAKYFGNENCGRMGQDHFAFFADSDGLEERIRALMEECKGINEGHSLPLHAGIYLNWSEGIAASMACDRAKFACDTLRNVFSSELSFYDNSMKDAEDRQQYIIANLDKAIQERWIKVYYQPIVRSVNGRVCDEEALARWIDPVKGFMSPTDFIPILEEHRLIYKLDLYVVECVLQKIKTLSGAGLNLMPQSVNLSRSDFDCCDIVEEICKRCDSAGISHDMLTIEITESMIGKDFEFMKAQIERFRQQGFAIWMDDFGSGYSSLDVLQSIKFDLIKFDMRFMQKFSSSDSSKIILTQLINMAVSLGIDTVCEGVETEEQVRFLRETGCSKLQGYYYEKPIPVEKILDKYAKDIQIGFEDPMESSYYEAVGRVDLHDLSVIAKGDMYGLDNVFNSMPMAVIEIFGEKVKFMRTNQSYRDLIKGVLGIDIDALSNDYGDYEGEADSSFLEGLLKSKTTDETMFITENLPGETTVHSCMRRIAVDPKTGTTATAVAVLSVTSGVQGTTYANIARALAADYSNLYYVNIETENFIEYSSKIGDERIAVERHGENFFEQSRTDALKFIHRDDRDRFISIFTKENVLMELDEKDNFGCTYRLLMNGVPTYVNMKAMRMQHDTEHIIIGVRNVDAVMQQQIAMENIRRNKLTYTRIMALTGGCICMYTVDPDTDDYYEYKSSEEYRGLGLARDGKDFFSQAVTNSAEVVAEADRERFIRDFTKENILTAIERKGVYEIAYQLLMDGEPVLVGLKAALVTEEDGVKLIIGVFRT